MALLVILCAGGVAAADPGASNQLVTRIGDGSQSIADLIDPKLGLWVIDGTTRTQSCGAAMLDVAIEAKVRATYADATCTNRKHDATCTLDDDYALRFDRTPRGLVLRALVRGDVDRARSIPKTACHDAKPLPIAPPPITATERRDAMTQDKNPTVATKAMLRKLGTGAWKLGAFADRERGLAVVEEPPDASDDPPPPRILRACGADLDRELAHVQEAVARLTKMTEDEEVNLSCSNAASTSECVLQQIGEWGDVVHLYFRQTDRGLVLDGYGLFDENGVVGPALRQHEIDIQQALTHAWVTPCSK
ncbi:MAG TPA: hypothetical protein VL463_18970 [Kofleriaceae bacterium]|nr:hypothetical protein [Kofleriaceae bacterium]